MRIAVWVSFWVLFLLHQDLWWWSDDRLVLGFLPVGLAWHAAFSVASALLWLAAVKFAWPTEIEDWASAGTDS
jgi:hypothetical protein